MDIHNYKKRLERTLENVKTSSEISEHNRKLCIRFHDFCFSNGLSFSKIERYLYDLFRLSKMFGDKNLDSADKEYLQGIVAQIEKKEWTVQTKHTFKVLLKKFYKWVSGNDESGVYPENIRWMKTNIKVCQKKLPEDLLTNKEVLKIIQHASSFRDKALIAVLYESGCRVGEIGGLRIKDLSFDEYGCRLSVFGKTGARVVRIINSSPYLQEWINNHPYNDERDRYVWIKTNGEPLTYTTIASVIRSSSKRAGLKKRVYPHLFRHSKATQLAGHLTEAQMKQYLGWTQSSKMAATYVHLNGRDTDMAILKLHGINVEEETQEDSKLLSNRKCLKCKTINEVTNKFCKICGLPLDEKEAMHIIESEQNRAKADEIMNKLIEDPEVLELIKRKIS